MATRFTIVFNSLYVNDRTSPLSNWVAARASPSPLVATASSSESLMVMSRQCPAATIDGRRIGRLSASKCMRSPLSHLMSVLVWYVLAPCPDSGYSEVLQCIAGSEPEIAREKALARHGEATRDAQHLARYERSRITSEEQDCASKVFRLPETPNRN